MATSTQRQRVVDWGRRSNVVWLDERVFWLNTLRRAVVNGAQILAAQQARVCALRAAGRDTALADSLLASFEDSQLALFRSLKRQEARHAGATLVGLRRGSTGVSARRS